MTVASDPAEAGIFRRVYDQVMRSIVRKERNDLGAMVALFLPADVAGAIALPGGEPAEALHLTLRILTPNAGAADPVEVEEWAAAVQRAAESTRVLVGNVSGVGRFNADQAGGEAVTYATLDVPGLLDLWQNVRWMTCDDDAMEDEPEHEFTPHVTLAYGDVEMPDLATTPIRFDRLTLAIGGERREYLFSGADVADPVAASIAKAAWDTAYVNDLPDSSFAVILPGGEKDADGKTTPRSLRKLPYKDADGTVDAPHLRNALARLEGTDLTDDQRSAAAARLKAAADQALAKTADDRAEAVAERLASDGITGRVEVAPFKFLPDLSGVVWETTWEGGKSAMYVDDGDEVMTMPEYLAKVDARYDALRKAIGNPRAQAVERSFRALTRRGHMAAGLAKTDDPPRYAVVKSDADAHYTLGVAYPAKSVGKDSQDVDAHADYMTDVELEKAAWRFLADGAPDSGLMHKDGTGGSGKVVESYIYRGPTWKVDGQSVEAGDWLLGVIWNDAAWADIQAGKLTGYSMQGMATRESA